tara:strand:- start:487 stop:1290 length:804 start_codon:yes stop_codon:yes gene_type:complete
MANHDYNIANQTAPNFRADLNNALLAIVSTNSGSSAPSTTFANQLWYDTSNNKLMMRNEANNAWITVLESDQTNNRVNLITDDIQYATSAVTEVKNTSGTTVLSLQVPSQSTAETGTENTQVMTPLRTKQSIEANAVTTVSAGTGISVASSGNTRTVSANLTSGNGISVSGATVSLKNSFMANTSSALSSGNTSSFTNSTGYPVIISGRSNTTSDSNYTISFSGGSATLDMRDGDSGTYDVFSTILPNGATISGNNFTYVAVQIRPD